MAPRKGKNNVLKPEGSAGRSQQSKAIITDKRFQHVHSDPRFQTMPKKQRKFQVDKRFQGMFTDPKFKTNYTVDKFGRKIETDTYGDDLHRMYEIDSDDEEQSGSLSEKSDDDASNNKEAGFRDASRVGFETDSSDDESSEDDSALDSATAEASETAEPDEDIPLGEETHRFAVVNLEWDRLRAVDLLVLFQSFANESGYVKDVSIYSSEYGRQMMQKEQESGPQHIWKDDADITECATDISDRDSDDDGDLDMERLRQYEQQKLKYYFAVVTCSSVECSAHLYAQCDGNEFEQTSNVLDLRFVPDDQQFSAEHLRDSATEVPSNYTPTEFYTSSIKHTNVKCTWDADDPNRKDFFRRRITNLNPDDRDIEVYLAPAESDAEGSDFVISADESDGEGNKVVLKKKARSRYLALLEDINARCESAEADKQIGDITISFEPGLSNTGQAIVDAKKKKEQIANETVWEARQRKRKEKKMKQKSSLTEEAGSDLLTKDESNDPFFRDAFKDDLYEEQPTKRSKKKKTPVKLTAEEAAENERKRAELELLVMDEGRDAAAEALHSKKGYNLQQLIEAHEGKRKKKGKKRQDDIANDDGLLVEGDGGAQLNVDDIIEDKRFKAIFEKEEFAIDPTDPAFKNTEVMAKLQTVRQKIRKEKSAEKEKAVRERKRKALDGDRVNSEEQQRPMKVDTATLIRKLKSNSQKRSHAK